MERQGMPEAVMIEVETAVYGAKSWNDIKKWFNRFSQREEWDIVYDNYKFAMENPQAQKEKQFNKMFDDLIAELLANPDVAFALALPSDQSMPTIKQALFEKLRMMNAPQNIIQEAFNFLDSIELRRLTFDSFE